MMFDLDTWKNIAQIAGVFGSCSVFLLGTWWKFSKVLTKIMDRQDVLLAHNERQSVAIARLEAEMKDLSETVAVISVKLEEREKQVRENLSTIWSVIQNNKVAKNPMRL